MSTQISDFYLLVCFYQAIKFESMPLGAARSFNLLNIFSVACLFLEKHGSHSEITEIAPITPEMVWSLLAWRVYFYSFHSESEAKHSV